MGRSTRARNVMERTRIFRTHVSQIVAPLKMREGLCTVPTTACSIVYELGISLTPAGACSCSSLGCVMRVTSARRVPLHAAAQQTMEWWEFHSVEERTYGPNVYNRMHKYLTLTSQNFTFQWLLLSYINCKRRFVLEYIYILLGFFRFNFPESSGSSCN